MDNKLEISLCELKKIHSRVPVTTLSEAITEYNNCQYDQIYMRALRHIIDMYYHTTYYHDIPCANKRILSTQWRKVGSHANNRIYAAVWCYRFTNIRMNALVEHFNISDKTIMRYVINSYKPKFRVFGLYIDKPMILNFDRSDKSIEFTSQQISTIILYAPNIAKSFIKKYYKS